MSGHSNVSAVSASTTTRSDVSAYEYELRKKQLQDRKKFIEPENAGRNMGVRFNVKGSSKAAEKVQKRRR